MRRDRSGSGRARRGLAAGFTLLEVMVALAILGMSLTALSQSQTMNIRAANRAKWMSVAVMLARYKMVEVEDDLFEEGFSDFEEEEKGDFRDEGFEDYNYVLKVDKVELPTTQDAEAALQGADGSGGAASEGSPESLMESLGTSMLSSYFEMIRNTLEQSIRRVQLSVQWQEGQRTREVTVAAYFTDPRKIGAGGGMPGGGAIPGMPGGVTAPPGGNTTPGRTPSSGAQGGRMGNPLQNFMRPGGQR